MTSTQLNLIINSQQVNSANSALQQFNQTGQQTQSAAEKLNISFSTLISTLTQLAGVYSLVQTVRAAFATAATEDRLQKGFDNLTGSVSKSKDMLNELITVSNNSQFSLAALGDATRQFMGLGLGADQSIKLVEDIANTLENLGSGEEQMTGIANALGRILEEGQSNLYVFRALAAQGIPAVKDVADTLGISFQRAMFLLRNGAISANDAIALIQYSMEKFNHDAIDTAPTYTQLWTSIGNSFKTGFGDMVKQVLDIGSKSALERFNAEIQNMFHIVGDAIRILEGLPPQFERSSEASKILAGIIKLLSEAFMVLVAIKLITWASDAFNALFSLIKQFANLGVISQALIVGLIVLVGIELGRWASEQVPELAKLAVILRAVGSFTGSSLRNVGEFIADKYLGGATAGTDAQNDAERTAHMNQADDATWKAFDKAMTDINNGNLGKGQGTSFFQYMGEDLKKLGENAKGALGPIQDLMRFMEVASIGKQGNYFDGKRPEVSTVIPENEELSLQKMIDSLNQKTSIIGLDPESAFRSTEVAKMQEILDKYNIAPGQNTAEGVQFLMLLNQAIDRLQGMQTLDIVAKSVGQSFATAFGQFITGAKSASAAAKQFVTSLEQMILKDLVLNKIASLIEGGITGLGTGLGGLFGNKSPSYTTGVTADDTGASLNTSVQFAMGGAFMRGVRMFAGGDVVNRPTLFGMAGGLGMMGEAGPEAILPLVRGPNGKLGVAAHGGGGQTVIHQHYWNIKTPDADSFKRSQRQISAMMQRSLR